MQRINGNRGPWRFLRVAASRPASASAATLALMIAVLCLFGCVSVFAQSSSASVTGYVSDPSGAKVVGAEVTAQNVETNVVATTTTNSDGRYAFPALAPGHYSIAVVKSGFRRAESTDFTLTVQQVAQFDFSLQVGAASQSVEVNAATQEVETSSSVSTLVDRQFVGNIPLNGRTLQSLVELTPGVVATPSSFGDSGQFSVNGQRADANYYTIDGVSANAGTASTVNVREMGGTEPGLSATGTTSNLVSIDAVQEFRIQTSSFAPEFGRTPGAQVSIVTRSGTNRFHGTVFEYFRNDVLDASNWFSGYKNDPVLPKAKERQNDFGGVLGGPIYKDKTFFFFSYEGARLRQPSTLESLVPDAAARAAAQGTAVQSLVDLFPLPTGADLGGGIAEANGTVSNPSSLDAVSLRIDHNLRKNWTIFARYNYAPSSSSVQGGGQPGFGEPLSYVGESQLRTQTGTLGTTTTIGNRIVNEFLFNYTRTNIFGTSTLTNYGGAIAPTLSEAIPASEGVTVDPSATAWELNVIGLGAADLGRTSANIQRQLNFVDNFSITAKSHSLKFGVDYRRLTPLTRPPSYLQLPVFCGVSSCPFLPTTYLLSQIALEAVVVSDQNVPILFNNYSLYGQDTWAITPRLTLTYGARWEFNPAPTGQDGVQLRTFVDPYDYNNLQLAPAGTPFYKSQHNHIAPRVGFAYSLRQSAGTETVIRGGGGVFYDLGNSDAADAASAFPYFRLGAQFFQPYPFPASAVTPIPFSLNPPYGQISTTDPNLTLPKTYQWNFSVQQGLGKAQTLTATYLGSSGHDLIRDILLHPPTAANGEFVIANGANSNYNGLQVQFQRQLTAGLQALVSYTWAHSIDDASTNNGGNAAPSGTGPFDVKNDRGSSDFDIRNALSGAVTYAVPNPNMGKAANLVLHNWGVDAILFTRSATPVDISASSYTGPGSSTVSLRPDVVPGQPFWISDPNAPGGKRLNPDAFAGPVGDGRTPAGTIPVDGSGNPLRQGTLGRNNLRGFGATQMDFAVRREFPIYENLKFQFRAEFFNIFNHPNFSNPEANLYNSTFGYSYQTLNTALGSGGGLSSIYQVGGPRSVQFAAKLIF